MTEARKKGIQINIVDAPCVEPPKHTKALCWTFITPKMQDNKAFELMVTTVEPGGGAEIVTPRSMPITLSQEGCKPLSKARCITWDRVAACIWTKRQPTA
jgi:hypothetical protein